MERYNPMPDHCSFHTSCTFLLLSVYLILPWSQTHSSASHLLALLLSTVFVLPTYASSPNPYTCYLVLLELGTDKIHVEKRILSCRVVRANVLVLCYDLVEARCDTMQDDIDQVVVSHRGIDIKSIDIVQVFLDSTCLSEITNLVKSLIWLIVASIVFPDSLLNLFPSGIRTPICSPPFYCLFFCTSTNVHLQFLLILGLRDVVVIIYLKNRFFHTLHGTTEFSWWWCFVPYHFQVIALMLLRRWGRGDVIDKS